MKSLRPQDLTIARPQETAAAAVACMTDEQRVAFAISIVRDIEDASTAFQLERLSKIAKLHSTALRRKDYVEAQS